MPSSQHSHCSNREWGFLERSVATGNSNSTAGFGLFVLIGPFGVSVSQYVKDFLLLVMLGSLMRGLLFEVCVWGGLWIKKGHEVSYAFRFGGLKKTNCLSLGMMPRQRRLEVGSLCLCHSARHRAQCQGWGPAMFGNWLKHSEQWLQKPGWEDALCWERSPCLIILLGPFIDPAAQELCYTASRDENSLSANQEVRGAPRRADNHHLPHHLNTEQMNSLQKAMYLLQKANTSGRRRILEALPTRISVLYFIIIQKEFIRLACRLLSG